MMTTINDEKQTATTETIVPKSPLEFSWTFWYLKPDKRVSWEKSLIRLIDVAFVEDFWATYNHLAVPSRLASAKINSDYYFFKKQSKIFRNQLTLNNRCFFLQFDQCGVNYISLIGRVIDHLFE